MKARRLLWIWALAAFAAAPPQSTRSEDLGPAKLLVASRELSDPNFAKTVVLLVNYDNGGVVGVILNRRSTVPLSRVFDDMKEAKDQSDPVYAGGPVEKTSALALLRSRAKAENGEPLFADVRLVAEQDQLRKTLASGADDSRFRVYLGYAGWTVRQLEHEVDLGAWHIFPADAAIVFDANPGSLWSRLIRRTEDRIAKR